MNRCCAINPLSANALSMIMIMIMMICSAAASACPAAHLNLASPADDSGHADTGGAASHALLPSDRRIKADVQTIEDALDVVNEVRLTSFRYNFEYLKAHPDVEDRVYYNVIAQEFATVFPGFVQGSGEHLKTGEEILAVNLHPLIIYSASAIQELHVLVKKQQKEIEVLEQQQMELQEGFESLKEDLKDRDLSMAKLVERLEALEKQVTKLEQPQPALR